MTEKQKGTKGYGAGVGSPVPVGEGSARAGSSRPSSIDCQASPVIYQAGALVAATGKASPGGGQTPNRLKRKNLQTSPTTTIDLEEEMEEGRSSLNVSVLDFKWDDEEKRSVKKMKEADPPRRKGSLTDTTGLMRNKLAELINKLAKEVRTLKQHVNDNRNTKVEIKSSAVTIASIVSQITARDMMEVVSLLPCTPAREITVIPSSREFGTQTEAAWGERTRNRVGEEARAKLKAAVEKGGGYQEFREIGDIPWPEDIFSKAKRGKGDLWAVSRDWDLAVLIPADFTMDKGTLKTVRDRYQGTDELRLQEAGVGEAAVLMDSIKIPKKDGSFCVKSRQIFHALAAKAEADTWEPKDVFKCVEFLRDQVLLGDRRKLAVLESEKFSPTELRRMVEFAFAGVEAEITLLPSGPRKEGDKPKKAREPTARRKRDHAVIVKAQEGKLYADLLRTVKEGIDLQDAGVQISAVRKTRGGDLLMTVRPKEGLDQAKVLRDQVAKKVAGVTVYARRTDPNVTVHISGMDCVVGEADVRVALEEALPKYKGGDMRVNALWPAYGETQNASVTLPKDGAREILQTGWVKIGWLSCRVREMVAADPCFRCWGFGHFAGDCKGKDRRGQCKRCGGDGHLAKDCQNRERCWTCEKEGHRGNTTGCPAFRSHLRGVAARGRGLKAQGEGGGEPRRPRLPND